MINTSLQIKKYLYFSWLSKIINNTQKIEYIQNKHTLFFLEYYCCSINILLALAQSHSHITILLKIIEEKNVI